MALVVVVVIVVVGAFVVVVIHNVVMKSLHFCETSLLVRGFFPCVGTAPPSMRIFMMTRLPSLEAYQRGEQLLLVRALTAAWHSRRMRTISGWPNMHAR